MFEIWIILKWHWMLAVAWRKSYNVSFKQKKILGLGNTLDIFKDNSDTSYPQNLCVKVNRSKLTLPVSILDQERKLTWIFTFTHPCEASKGFTKVLKAFIKPSEALQKVKIKIQGNFYFNITFWNAWAEMG